MASLFDMSKWITAARRHARFKMHPNIALAMKRRLSVVKRPAAAVTVAVVDVKVKSSRKSNVEDNLWVGKIASSSWMPPPR